MADQPLYFLSPYPTNGEGPIVIACPFDGETGGGNFVAKAHYNGESSILAEASHGTRQFAIANCRAALIAAGFDLDKTVVLETNKMPKTYRVY